MYFFTHVNKQFKMDLSFLNVCCRHVDISYLVRNLMQNV
jgi:hypothetical protein